MFSVTIKHTIVQKISCTILVLLAPIFAQKKKLSGQRATIYPSYKIGIKTYFRYTMPYFICLIL